MHGDGWCVFTAFSRVAAATTPGAMDVETRDLTHNDVVAVARQYHKGFLAVCRSHRVFHISRTVKTHGTREIYVD